MKVWRIYCRQAVLGARWLLFLALGMSFVNWFHGERFDRALELLLAFHGMVLALVVARLRTRPFVEYLRSLPLGRERDLYRVHAYACAWGVAAGLFVHVSESTAAPYWMLRAVHACLGWEPPPFHRRPLAPLPHLVGHPLFAFWGTTWLLVRRPGGSGIEVGCLVVGTLLALAWVFVVMGPMTTALASWLGAVTLVLGLVGARRVRNQLAILPLDAPQYRGRPRGGDA